MPHLVSSSLYSFCKVISSKAYYYLLECKNQSAFCHRVSEDLNISAISPAELISNTDTGELHIFINGVLRYIYGDRSYNFEYGNLADYKNHIYWVVYTGRGDDLLYKFGMCDIKSKQTCEILQSYSNPGFNHMNLAVNTEGKDLYIFLDGILTYAFDNASRNYDLLGSLEDCNTHLAMVFHQLIEYLLTQTTISINIFSMNATQNTFGVRYFPLAIRHPKKQSHC